ncbi:MAG: DoxX family membrane protein [Nitrospira sp.]|jgi:uncharacterized membrane protein|nr:MAG: DoxX family membrane protein [Nitrospira sp.]
MNRLKYISRWLYGLSFVAGGANHFVNTPFYVSIMPPYLPWPVALVYLSGVAEIGLGGLLLFEGWSRLAAWGLIALLIAVFPANVHMALHPELYQWASPLGLWLRLSLQGLLIAWAYWYTRPPSVRAGAERGSRSH